MNIRPPAATWKAPSPGTGKLIALKNAELLCRRHGRGMRVRALSGKLWITEADSSADQMLSPGDEVELARAGKAIVSAIRPARLVIELIAGNARPSTTSAWPVPQATSATRAPAASVSDSPGTRGSQESTRSAS